MKITKVKQETKFNPIEIKLLIESEDEFNSLSYLTSFDESIPELFDYQIQKEIITKFLADLRKQLYS